MVLKIPLMAESWYDYIPESEFFSFPLFFPVLNIFFFQFSVQKNGNSINHNDLFDLLSFSLFLLSTLTFFILICWHSVKYCVVIGEGSGANIAARFAVSRVLSLHPFSFLSSFPFSTCYPLTLYVCLSFRGTRITLCFFTHREYCPSSS